MRPLTALPDRWRDRADDPFVPPDVAKSVRACADELDRAIDDYWNEPMTVREAAEWGGYTERHIHDGIRAGEIPLHATSPRRILRRHVPMRGLPPDAPPRIREVS